MQRIHNEQNVFYDEINNTGGDGIEDNDVSKDNVLEVFKLYNSTCIK
jgi:hypothetical protein